MNQALSISVLFHLALIVAAGAWVCPWIEGHTASHVAYANVDLVLLAEHSRPAPRHAISAIQKMVATISKPIQSEMIAPSHSPQQPGIAEGSVGVGSGDQAQLLSIDDYMKLAVRQNTPPIYPRLARLRGEQGRVLVRVIVTPKGEAPESAVLEQSSGSEMLDKLSLETVQHWHFPAFSSTKAGPVSFLIPFRFSLKD